MWDEHLFCYISEVLPVNNRIFDIEFWNTWRTSKQERKRSMDIKNIFGQNLCHLYLFNSIFIKFIYI